MKNMTNERAMASRNKREIASSIKSNMESTSLQTSDSAKAQDSEEFGLLISSDISDEAVETSEDIGEESLAITKDKSASYDAIQIQIDQQLQQELDSYVGQEQSLLGQLEEAYLYEHQSPHRNRTPSSRSSVFDLPKEDVIVLDKHEKKLKRHTEDISLTRPSKVQKEKKKKKRKAKSFDHDRD